jgi:lysophospholipase L1-like esterase
LCCLSAVIASPLASAQVVDKGQFFKSAKASAESSADQALEVYGPQDPNFRYEGRFDWSKPEAPLMTWEASRIRVDFEGTVLILRVDGSGAAFLNAEIDGRPYILEARGGGKRYQFQNELKPGKHSLTLFKRSEASAGTCRFRGMEIEAGKKISPQAFAYASRMIFFGDSITAGSCDEDGDTDQWANYRTHNAAVSYANLVAEALKSDAQNISVSGMGMVTGWNSLVRAPEVWDRLTFDPKAPRADLASWKPDLVFVNLGENDGSYSQAQGKGFPADFADSYVAYADAIKAAWPKAHLVLLRGGMYNGALNQALIDAWDRVVEHFKDDRLVHSYAFTHFSGNHPRIADHRILADELLAWIRAQDSLRSFVPE